MTDAFRRAQRQCIKGVRWGCPCCLPITAYSRRVLARRARQRLKRELRDEDES